MTAHVAESDLALYVSGDLGRWRGAVVRFHVVRCGRCLEIAEAYRGDRERVRSIASDLPEDLDWERLAAEMTANIRVGLAAGECVAPRKPRSAPLSWRPAAVMAGVVVLFATGWWLNMPPSTTRALGRALMAVVHGHGSVTAPLDEHGMVVSADEKGIELHENGGSLGISQGTALPVTVSISVQGSASARYVDADTGQMTITSVYAQ